MYGPALRHRLPLLLLALLAAASCAPGRTHNTTARLPAGSPAKVPAAVTTGADQIVPLTTGPAAFASIGSTLRGARQSVELELYEFQRADLAELLLDAHDRGVAVTAIHDPSERSSRSTWARLQQGGVRLVAFPLERQTIDHVKLLIVDGIRAIVGGINWGVHSEENHDFDVLVSGPVVDNLERVFRQDLQLAGIPSRLPPVSADRQVEVLVTRPGDAIRSAALSAIAAARNSIDIEMFVLSDGLVLDALTGAARRGVRVRVLLDRPSRKTPRRGPPWTLPVRPSASTRKPGMRSSTPSWGSSTGLLSCSVAATGRAPGSLGTTSSISWCTTRSWPGSSSAG